MTISREDTGEVIYQSGYLDQSSVEKARLDVNCLPENTFAPGQL
ncbi:MAG: hypothetical protein ACLTC4_12125 [Hungatella hathewayi]